MAIAPIVPLTTKAILWYKRLGYPSSQRIVDAIDHNIVKGINLPKSVTVSDFPIHEVETPFLKKSKAQPHRILHMAKHSRHPYEMLHRF